MKLQLPPEILVRRVVLIQHERIANPNHITVVASGGKKFHVPLNNGKAPKPESILESIQKP